MADLATMGVLNEPRNNKPEPEVELIDEFCDPDNPVTIPFQEISAAAYKIKGGIEKTPCEVSTSCMLFRNGIGLDSHIKAT